MADEATPAAKKSKLWGATKFLVFRALPAVTLTLLVAGLTGGYVPTSESTGLGSVWDCATHGWDRLTSFGASAGGDALDYAKNALPDGPAAG